ncbi:ATP-binding protein [Halarchaeum sp. CBA1220]|uniref:ATP-binding protein n=1 Tax=Halarchaeum sp. CBA1220 TaxID=1853682 RepID=UPI000F3A93B2|nr:ATP-binding protein [Halarchaeum sp. CBA1220]QLC33638.1 ATP-binding protein [Halarchaeum sp. CBA1220]
MSDDNGGDDLYTPAQYREHADGYGARDALGHEFSGIVHDAKVSRYLGVLANHYDPTDAENPAEMPARWADLEDVQDIVSLAATERGREAMQDGDMQMLKHLTGQTDQRADVSGMKAIDKLRTLMTGPAPMFYLWAEPGTGKTNFALLLAQLWQAAHEGEALLASNIRTLRETDDWTDDDGTTREGWLSNFGELQEWIQQDGDPLHNDQTPKLFLFDEASSSAGGSGTSGYETKAKMGPLAYKIRKYGGALIVIGHDGKDVHPLIRELGKAIHKEGLKDATVYDDVQNRRGKGEILQMTGIPETDYRYDDGEPTAWSWSNGDDEDLEYDDVVEDVAMWTIVNEREKEDPLAYRKLAKKTPWDASTCSRRWKRYKEDGKYVDAVQRVEDIIA